ncbi:phosphoribosylanthranilate isomerase [candidate division FCPU426 bacterium]|nr:phosphoribosylanthranilate isomerase [candidate division FCPU426 bacterium]
MIRVKICGLTRPQDAKAAVAAGADAIGLVFAPSPRKVGVRQAKAILAAVAPFVWRCGVFVNQDPDWVLHLARELALDRLQFHGQESGLYLRRFAKNRVIKALQPGHQAQAPKTDPAPAAAAFLVDAFVPGVAGGTGKAANWNYARQLKKFGKAVILSGGLHAGNVGEAIRRVQPDMVDVSSGVEIRPGIKSPEKIAQFIKCVRRLDKAAWRRGMK